MKYKLSFVLLLIPFGASATHHCPAIDTITRVDSFYTAATEGGDWVGNVQGSLITHREIKDFSEALLIVDGDNSTTTGQGKFQKCTYNLETEGKQVDMYYGATTWMASVSEKPNWKYQQGAFIDRYTCSEVAPEDCKFDILVPDATS